MTRVSLAHLGPDALKQAIEQIGSQKPKRSKYSNVRTEYESDQGFVRTYDSKGEADHAAKLDYGIRAALIKWWLPQVTIPLPGGVKYRADFMVAWADGRITFQDFKGADTQDSINKRKQVLQFFGIDVEIVKR